MAVKITGIEWHKRDPKLLVAIADFGDGREYKIPLPTHFSPEDRTKLVVEAARSMESLAEALVEALLDHAGHMREPERGARM
jgi:hypothetical protein